MLLAAMPAAWTRAACINAAETPAPWLSGRTYIFDNSTLGRVVTACCTSASSSGITANEHAVAQNSAVVVSGEHHAVRIGEVFGEPLGRKVGVDERGDVLGRRRRRAGQRKGARGDGGQLPRVGGFGQRDVYSHDGYTVAARYRSHWARW